MFRSTITGLLFFILVQLAWGQNATNDLAGRRNYLATAVPFLTIPLSPTLNGVITSVPDGTSGAGIYGNLGLLALDSTKFQATADFVPWIRQLFPDRNLFGLGVGYRLNEKHTVGISLRYFSNGILTVAATPEQFHPREFAGTIFYAYNIDKLTGFGIGVKYIYSNLTGGYYVGGIESHPGVAIAADLGFSKQLQGRNGKVDQFIGICLNNIGSKISYTQNSDKDFIPITLTAGYGFRLNLAKRQSLALSYEFSKMLVPTPPAYYPDSLDGYGYPVIQAGYDPNVGVFRGMIQSFYDAPGSFKEEFHETTHSFGIVYKYGFLSAGAGYHYQNETKGTNKIFTFGLSGDIKFKKNGTSGCRMSVSYLLPVLKNSPLRNTVQLGMNFVNGND